MKIIMDNLDILFLVILLIINTSLPKFKIPNLKCVVVKPLLKKRGLNPNVAKNC